MPQTKEPNARRKTSRMDREHYFIYFIFIQIKIFNPYFSNALIKHVSYPKSFKL